MISEDSVHGKLTAKQKYHGRSYYQRNAAYLIVARKQIRGIAEEKYPRTR